MEKLGGGNAYSQFITPNVTVKPKEVDKVEISSEALDKRNELQLLENLKFIENQYGNVTNILQSDEIKSLETPADQKKALKEINVLERFMDAVNFVKKQNKSISNEFFNSKAEEFPKIEEKAISRIDNLILLSKQNPFKLSEDESLEYSQIAKSGLESIGKKLLEISKLIQSGIDNPKNRIQNNNDIKATLGEVVDLIKNTNFNGEKIFMRSTEKEFSSGEDDLTESLGKDFIAGQSSVQFGSEIRNVTSSLIKDIEEYIGDGSSNLFNQVIEKVLTSNALNILGRANSYRNIEDLFSKPPNNYNSLKSNHYI